MNRDKKIYGYELEINTGTEKYTKNCLIMVPTDTEKEMRLEAHSQAYASAEALATRTLGEEKARDCHIFATPIPFRDYDVSFKVRLADGTETDYIRFLHDEGKGFFRAYHEGHLLLKVIGWVRNRGGIPADIIDFECIEAQ